MTLAGIDLELYHKEFKMTVYFVTVLIMLNVNPPLGWIQHTFAYTDKKLCEQYIEEFKDLYLYLLAHTLEKNL